MLNRFEWCLKCMGVKGGGRGSLKCYTPTVGVDWWEKDSKGNKFEVSHIRRAFLGHDGRGINK